jgi:hypothetical protein
MPGQLHPEASNVLSATSDHAVSVLQPFAKQIRRHSKRFGRFRSGEIQNLTEDIRETMRSIEALEYAEGAAGLDRFDGAQLGRFAGSRRNSNALRRDAVISIP